MKPTIFIILTCGTTALSALPTVTTLAEYTFGTSTDPLPPTTTSSRLNVTDLEGDDVDVVAAGSSYTAIAQPDGFSEFAVDFNEAVNDGNFLEFGIGLKPSASNFWISDVTIDIAGLTDVAGISFALSDGSTTTSLADVSPVVGTNVFEVNQGYSANSFFRLVFWSGSAGLEPIIDFDGASSSLISVSGGIPEPSTYLAGLGALAMVGLFVRRRLTKADTVQA